MSGSSTPRAPLKRERMTGSRLPLKIEAIFEPAPSPNHRIITGMSAVRGMG